MSKLFASLIVLAISSACAGARTPAPATPTPPVATRPSPPSCAASGDVLFEIDTTDLAAGPQSELVYASGAWKLNRAGGGEATGCLSASDLATIQHDVAASTWQETARTGIQCHMVHAPTTYLANGKVVHVDSGCSSPVLDDVSAHAAGEIQRILTAAIRP